MRIVLTSFVSLDGVYQGPGSPDEDRTDGFERGGWLVPFVDAVFEQRATEWTSTATGFLFGHRTYDAFAEVWPTISDPADHNATRLNRFPKWVVATTPVDVKWGPVTVLEHDVELRLAALKAEQAGELQIHGSGRLGRSLMAAGLVDELRLVTAPVIVGQGRRLFDKTSASRALDLASQETTPLGLTLARYTCQGVAAVGTYVRGETNLVASAGSAEGSREH